MLPNYHPPTEDLLDYVTGVAPEWLSLMVSCHLTLCARCRDETSWLDDLGGALLSRARDGLDADALALKPPPLATPIARAKPPGPSNLLAQSLPRPLHGFFQEREPRWRWLAPGVQHVPLEVAGATVRLLRFCKGFVIPEHSHSGREWLLVLDGEIGDSSTGLRYAKGDVCTAETDKIHTQDVAKDEPCIAVVANVAPVVPRNVLGRVLARIVGL